MKDEKFWTELRKAQEDPRFRKAVKEFVRRTSI
jgi:hypothetical protein